jgi:hypothetical protein
MICAQCLHEVEKMGQSICPILWMGPPAVGAASLAMCDDISLRTGGVGHQFAHPSYLAILLACLGGNKLGTKGPAG